MTKTIKLLAGFHKNKLYSALFSLGLLILSILLVLKQQLNTTEALIMVIFTFVLSIIAVIDFKLKTIPNELILSLLLLRIGHYIFISVQLGRVDIRTILFDFVIAFLCSMALLLGRLFKASVGWGDVKLLFIMALYLGISGAFNMMFYAILSSFVFTITVLVLKKMTLKDTIPFAPFLFIGYVITLFIG